MLRRPCSRRTSRPFACHDLISLVRCGLLTPSRPAGGFRLRRQWPTRLAQPGGAGGPLTTGRVGPGIPASWCKPAKPKAMSGTGAEKCAAAGGHPQTAFPPRSSFQSEFPYREQSSMLPSAHRDGQRAISAPLPISPASFRRCRPNRRPEPRAFPARPPCFGL